MVWQDSGMERTIRKFVAKGVGGKHRDCRADDPLVMGENATRR